MNKYHSIRKPSCMPKACRTIYLSCIRDLACIICNFTALLFANLQFAITLCKTVLGGLQKALVSDNLKKQSDIWQILQWWNRPQIAVMKASLKKEIEVLPHPLRLSFHLTQGLADQQFRKYDDITKKCVIHAINFMDIINR